MKWTDIGQQAFDEIKQIVARDTLLIYPDFNERYDIHTDASAFQLGSVISHNGKKLPSIAVNLRQRSRTIY